MTSLTVPDGVGRTALGVALVRARESNRTDRLFDDPYAEAFLAAAPGAVPDLDATPGGPVPGVVHGVVIRTRYFDDFLAQAWVAGCRQVVLVAAGLDTRAFRLPWPDDVRLFEMDLPEVLEFKDAVLDQAGATPRCHRSTVPVDLRDAWPEHLLHAGFQPSEPTAWLIEGLLVYLTAEEAARLLGMVGYLSAPGSRLSCNVRTVPESEHRPNVARFTDLWKGGLGRDLPGWLTGHGWDVRVDERDVVANSYGRPSPSTAPGGYLTAVLAA